MKHNTRNVAARCGSDKVTTFTSVLQVPIFVLALHEHVSRHVGFVKAKSREAQYADANSTYITVPKSRD